MTLSSISYQPWECVYMWFLVPGLVTWIAATIWWARTTEQFPPILIQCIGAIEVALGGGAAFMAGMVSINTAIQNSGAWDPAIESADRAFMSQVALIGWGMHLILLTGTLIMTVLTTNRRSKMHKP